MRFTQVGFLLVGFLVPPAVLGAGFAHDGNFTVLAPDQALAEEVLASANAYRRQIAEEWLGEALPPSVGETLIHVELSEREDTGLTWAIDSPQRRLHKTWLTTSREKAVGNTLRHEMAHIVLATRFPDHLPAWIEEAVASSYDDEERILARREIIDWYARTGNWPNIGSILGMRNIIPSDEASYAVAASVSEYLLSRGDAPTLLRFAQTGKRLGWDRALQDCYRIPTVRDLQTAWQSWVSGRGDTQAHASSVPRTGTAATAVRNG